MRILRLTARRLRHDPGAVPADDVAAQIMAALLTQAERGVAHVVLSQLSADLVEFAVFLQEGTSALTDVGGHEGWGVDHTIPDQDLW